MPAYREADSLRTLLPALVSAVHALTPNAEIIVADSMQPLDDTADVCRANNVTHILRTGGELYGDAVRSAIRASRGQFVQLMDADGSHNPAALASLWAHREEKDIVIGSRYVPGDKPKIRNTSSS